ncbi:MAG: YaaR family protein [Treponema sp.]|nr:YaaR family protein [Treponema sp.]
MADISSVNTQLTSQSLYFAATQSASQQLAQQTKKTEKKEKSSFASSLSKKQETSRLISEGFPVELAGMTEDEAVVFLKDEMDIAGDQLKSRQDLVSMENYRKKVSQFMKYIVKINYNFIKTREQRKLPSGRVITPMYQVQVIDQKLNQLASEMLILHGANLNLLAKVEEINGLIIDLMAE